MRRYSLAALIALVIATPALQAAQPLDLETIMANPDWIGQPVEQPARSLDSKQLHNAPKRDGSTVRDWYGAIPTGGRPADLGMAEAPRTGAHSVIDRPPLQAEWVSPGLR